MARYQVILAYDGTNFHGSQLQADDRTVQSVVEVALRKLNWTGHSILFAGRTDAGVHASGQVAAFDLVWNHPPQDLQNALNAMLPEDAAVWRAMEVSPDFHPRYDALFRSYCYRAYCQPVRDPLRERYAWQVWPVPEIRRLQSVAKTILGVHDFAAFGSPTSPGGSTVREVTQADWEQVDDEFYFSITGNAFLYHMVRRLVFVMVSVGQGKLEVEDVLEHLQTPHGPVLQGLAPPNGLSLVKVYYPSAEGENIDQNKI
jgi:tRNA pseudouridine38-40 synthase